MAFPFIHKCLLCLNAFGILVYCVCAFFFILVLLLYTIDRFIITYVIQKHQPPKRVTCCKVA